MRPLFLIFDIFIVYVVFVPHGTPHGVLQVVMEDYKIESYSEQLKSLCDSCKLKCKNYEKLCAIKRLAWSLAKREIKRREKVGVNK